MGVRSHLRAIEPVGHFILLAVLAAVPVTARAQQASQSQRTPLARPDQDAYLKDLIRSAPKGWAHGKDWVLISPYVLGRNVTERSIKTLCPDDAALANAQNGGADAPSWIFSNPEPCKQLAATHDSAVLVLEDRNDGDASYLLFLSCDAKQRRNHCDIDPFGGQGTMKLEESDHRGKPQFDVLAPNVNDKTSRFLVIEVWHPRNPQLKPDAK